MVSHLPNGQIILRFAERSTINPFKSQFIRIRSDLSLGSCSEYRNNYTKFHNRIQNSLKFLTKIILKRVPP